MTQRQETSEQKAKKSEESPWPGVFAILFVVHIIAGVLWADAHPDDRNSLIGMDVVDYLSQVLLWPLHLVGVLPF